MNRESPCPAEEKLREHAHGRLDKSAALAVLEHLISCRKCRDYFDAFSTGKTPPSVSSTATQSLSEEKETAGLPPRPVNDGEPEDDGDEDPLEGISFLQPPVNPQTIGRLGSYDVLGVLGRGGMGVVLKAFDTTLHRIVAIKVLSPQLATSKDARRRFLREGRAAAGINHPNVVVIHAVEEREGMPYLVMECVAGRTLRERAKQLPGLDLASILRIGAQIAAGLAAAHQQGVIHRDIKPTNVMLEDGIERVKITDFGLALVALDASQATTAPRVVGTPAYMSPEQVRGERVGPRSDLFSLGCVLWSMVTGKSPFQGSHALDAARRVEEQVVPSLHVVNSQIPRKFADIVSRLLEKDPADRFQSAEEVRDLLQLYLVQVSQGESGPLFLPPPRKHKPWRRRPWLVGGATVLTLAIVSAFLWSVLKSDQASSAGSPPPSSRLPQPGVLRVSQAGAGECRTIGDALKQAKPGWTIRVEDSATYTEAISLEDPSRLRDVTLEAIAGATLAAQEGPYAAIIIRGTPGVTIRGFNVRTAGNQHALMILGKADRTTIENVRWEHSPGSGWACIYLAEGACGTSEGPIRIRNCSIQAGKLGMVIGGMFEGGVRQVVVENNRFSESSTHVVLKLPADSVQVKGNCFIHGTGIAVEPIDPQAEAKDLQLVNNTFFRTPTWLRIPDRGGERALVYNNLVLEADRVGLSDGAALPDVVRSWTFRGNWWEPGPQTDLKDVSLVAEHHGPVKLLSRDPANPNFLRPTHDSPLVGAGIGGDFPRRVGAFDPPGN